MPKLPVPAGLDVLKATDRLQCAAPSDWSTDFSQCLFEWQTLIGGVLALIAALIAAKLVQRQIRQAEAFNKDQLRRRRNSTRVMLPFALSSIYSFCQSIGTNLAMLVEALEESDRRDNPVVEPAELPRLGNVDFPSGATEALSRFVECLDDTNQEKHAAELIAQLQVLNARYDGDREAKNPISESLYGRLIQAGTVKFLVESMFNYARFSDETSFAKVGVLDSKSAWREIQKSTNGLIFDRPIIDRYAREINRKIERLIEIEVSPWLEKFEH